MNRRNFLASLGLVAIAPVALLREDRYSVSEVIPPDSKSYVSSNKEISAKSYIYNGDLLIAEILSLEVNPSCQVQYYSDLGIKIDGRDAFVCSVLEPSDVEIQFYPLQPLSYINDLMLSGAKVKVKYVDDENLKIGFEGYVINHSTRVPQDSERNHKMTIKLLGEIRFEES